MGMMVVELYEALKAAGAPEEKAKEAATAVADLDERFDRIERELAVLSAEVKVVKWLVGGVGFGVLLLVIKSFIPS